MKEPDLAAKRSGVSLTNCDGETAVGLADQQPLVIYPGDTDSGPKHQAPSAPHRTVTDQFGTHKQVYSPPTKFCVPSRKETQPRSCQSNAGGTCCGTCPDPKQQCVTVLGATPSCRCMTPCTRNPAGACVNNGQCPPRQKCQSAEQGCFCI